jgi:molybdopterin converting factor small subunit
MSKVEFNYNGVNINIQCEQSSRFETIIQKFCCKVKKNKDELCFLYNGSIIKGNPTFFELANSLDKKRKIMSIIVTDAYAKNDSLLLKENKELKDKINKLNKKIEEQNTEIQESKYKITMIKSENMKKMNDLMDIIDKKDKEIAVLKHNDSSKIKKDLINPSDLICVNFISSDQRIHYSIPCTGNTVFFELEEKLYKDYTEYRESQNRFICNGSDVLRFKTINENEMRNNSVVLFFPTDD